MTDAEPAQALAPSEPPSGFARAEPDVEFWATLERGDRSAALALAARAHADAIGRVCMAMVKNNEEANDITQETLLHAYEKFDTFRRDAPLRAWLLGIARKKCLQHIEKHSRRQAKLRLIKGTETEPPTDERLIIQEQAAQARAALLQMRPTEREALLLRYTGELSFRGVAAACGIDEPAARKRVSRAIASLRDLLKELNHEQAK